MTRSKRMSRNARIDAVLLTCRDTPMSVETVYRILRRNGSYIPYPALRSLLKKLTRDGLLTACIGGSGSYGAKLYHTTKVDSIAGS